MANIVYIATSIDGYIASKDGNIDWLLEVPNPDNSDFGFAEFMKNIDCLVMGRKTFASVQDFSPWPYTKPVFVLSKTLQQLPPQFAGKAQLLNISLLSKGGPSSMASVVAHLKQQGFKNIYVDGGQTIQSFLAEDLIDEMTITRVPILLGSGISLFAERNFTTKFEHLETVIFNNSLVKSRYQKIKTT